MYPCAMYASRQNNESFRSQTQTRRFVLQKLSDEQIGEAQQDEETAERCRKEKEGKALSGEHGSNGGLYTSTMHVDPDFLEVDMEGR